MLGKSTLKRYRHKEVKRFEAWLGEGMEGKHLARARMGALMLRNRTGKTDNEKQCTICREGLVEDEYHLLLQCTSMEHLRTDMRDQLKNQWGPEGYKDWEKMEEDAKFRILVGLEGEMEDELIKIVGGTIIKMMEYRKVSVNEV